MHLDPEVSRHLGGVRSPEVIRTYLSVDIAHWTEHGFGIWALGDRSGLFVGRTDLRRVVIAEQAEVKIAYTLGRAVWGQGLATEIADALITIGFARLQLTSLVGIVVPDAAASRRVLQKSASRWSSGRFFAATRSIFTAVLGLRPDHPVTLRHPINGIENGLGHSRDNFGPPAMDRSIGTV